MSRGEENPALVKVHEAIQAFSNSLANGPDQVAVVTNALITWEEVTFDSETGGVVRETIYAAIGDQATRAAASVLH